MNSQEIYDQVNQKYSSVTSSAEGNYERNVARAFGYSEDELSDLPAGANLGLSCGNPLAIAGLREGETVVDLGCGAGFDVFQAARKVGLTGLAIGVDMNKTMLEKAQANAVTVSSPSNVRFVESPITSITALPSGNVDCVISNCVINLVPEKKSVFEEMYRLLKPGGRVAITDILARKELSDEVRRSVGLYVGCVAGAGRVDECEMGLKEAGFIDILIVDSKHDLNVYFDAGVSDKSCCGGRARPDDDASSMPSDSATVAAAAKADMERLGIKDLNEWVGSFKMYALKA